MVAGVCFSPSFVSTFSILMQNCKFLQDFCLIKNPETVINSALWNWLYDRNRLTRVTGVNRMTKVRYLSSYLEWVSHQDFKNIAYVGFFRHFVCVLDFVIVFVIVFVFVFVSSNNFWTPFIISFHNMYGYSYRGLLSLRAEIMIISKVMTYGHT